uniref:ATPase subunit 8 n=1 Tax=Limnogonus intermedius TaxID=913169 RepID=A0A5B9XXR2_9HEMI|nr:ATPase subunit 8 [Limnogonus intermedius]QEH58919.1 ATPase subunit 8 [Limnogonus intermedius]
MSPMSWMTLMIVFILSLIIINSMMYFNKKYSTKTSMKNMTKNTLNWKW